MSTYYYIVCDSHSVVSDTVAGRYFPDRWLNEPNPPTAEFLRDHADCNPRPRIVSEYDVEAETYSEVSP